MKIYKKRFYKNENNKDPGCLVSDQFVLDGKGTLHIVKGKVDPTKISDWFSKEAIDMIDGGGLRVQNFQFLATEGLTLKQKLSQSLRILKFIWEEVE